MSFQRLTYDHCRYSRELNENTNILKYIINDNRYEHPNKCRHELGLLGGATVSHVRGNLVDMESELRGITRNLSMCAVSQSKPLEEQPIILNDKTKPIDSRKIHLPSCQMIEYPKVPIPPPQSFNRCKNIRS